MNPHCLLGHHWVGCRCERCGALRDRDHEWAGCRCRRCGLARDQDHDWELDGCRLLCQRCGYHGEAVHDWDGCLCRRCGAANHRWSAGVCVHCGERCQHIHTDVEYDCYAGADPDSTPHRSLHPGRLVCRQCGQTVSGRAAA
jgi:hypothetical protein